MSIPSEIFNFLMKNKNEEKKVIALRIAVKYKKAKSTAYGYIREFNQSLIKNKKTNIKKNSKRLQFNEFKEFMFTQMKNGGFKSTTDLFFKFSEKYKWHGISKRTFNRYFLSFRLYYKEKYKSKSTFRISRSQNKLRGFYSLRRYSKPSDY